MLIGVRQQRQEAGALDRRRELALIEALGASDAAGNDLAGFGDIVLQRGQIFVVDHRHAVRGEAAEFLAPCKARSALFSH
jgi:hypothetical protein